MTRLEAYELAAGRWGAAAAVLQLGDRCVVGRWVPRSAGLLEASPSSRILATTVHVLAVAGEGESFLEAARAAGLAA